MLNEYLMPTSIDLLLGRIPKTTTSWKLLSVNGMVGTCSCYSGEGLLDFSVQCHLLYSRQKGEKETQLVTVTINYLNIWPTYTWYFFKQKKSRGTQYANSLCHCLQRYHHTKCHV